VAGKVKITGGWGRGMMNDKREGGIKYPEVAYSTRNKGKKWEPEPGKPNEKAALPWGRKVETGGTAQGERKGTLTGTCEPGKVARTGDGRRQSQLVERKKKRAGKKTEIQVMEKQPPRSHNVSSQAEGAAFVGMSPGRKGPRGQHRDRRIGIKTLGFHGGEKGRRLKCPGTDIWGAWEQSCSVTSCENEEGGGEGIGGNRGREPRGQRG